MKKKLGGKGVEAIWKVEWEKKWAHFSKNDF